MGIFKYYLIELTFENIVLLLKESQIIDIRIYKMNKVRDEHPKGASVLCCKRHKISLSIKYTSPTLPDIISRSNQHNIED